MEAFQGREKLCKPVLALTSEKNPKKSSGLKHGVELSKLFQQI